MPVLQYASMEPVSAFAALEFQLGVEQTTVQGVNGETDPASSTSEVTAGSCATL